MTSREIIRKLEEAGFVLYRRATRHLLYKKGEYIVPVVPGSTSNNPRAVKSLRATLRRVERGQLRPAGRFV